MNTLLSPSESQAFQSFLSQLDRVDAFNLAPEWGMYSPSLTDAAIKTAEGKEELSKATKNLMSLDAAWNNHLHSTAPPPGYVYRPLPFNSPPTSPVHNEHTFQHPPPLQHQHSFPPSAFPTPARSASFPEHQQPQQLQQQSRKRPLGITPDTSVAATKKRSRQPSFPSSSSSATAAPAPPRQNSAPSSSHLKSSPPSSSGTNFEKTVTSFIPSETPQNGAANRPALLTASQKKANHIQSEQKRRANIRRGYEALCDIVPALRDAIAAEEEANVGATAAGRRRRGRMLGEDGEKMDGRAGPRSESVVLHKTIEHINDLLSHRQALMDRLQHAQSLVPQHHPALYRPHGSDVPLWERAWDGGSGLPFGRDGHNAELPEGDGEGDNNMDEDDESEEDM